jgi:hypothetical protein
MGCTILINSLEFGHAIRQEIENRFSEEQPTIVSIEDLLNGLRDQN